MSFERALRWSLVSIAIAGLSAAILAARKRRRASDGDPRP